MTGRLQEKERSTNFALGRCGGRGAPSLSFCQPDLSVVAGGSGIRTEQIWFLSDLIVEDTKMIRSHPMYQLLPVASCS